MDGKEKRLSLGTYPDVGLKEARERRDQARKMVGQGVDAICAVHDQLFDLACGIGRALRQEAHLRCHHAKATTLIASARRLDSGVQCQDVGLESDAVNHADDVAHALARCVNATHGVDHTGHGTAPLLRDLASGRSQLTGLMRA